jgi:membrane protein required for colicin V production
MSPFDIFFLIVLALGAWRGWSNGLLKEVLGLVGVFVGFGVAYLLYEQVGERLAPAIGTSPGVAGILAFGLIWMGIPLLLGLLGSLLTQFLNWIGLGSVNSLGGALVGVIKFWFLLGALAGVLSTTHLVSAEVQQQSVLFEPLRQTTAIAFSAAREQWRATTAQ